MNKLIIILILLTATLLIANIVMFTIERKTTKNELNFDKTKTKIILLTSEDAHKIVKSEIKITKKYNVLDSAIGDLKTKHGPIFISAYLVERK